MSASCRIRYAQQVDACRQRRHLRRSSVSRTGSPGGAGRLDELVHARETGLRITRDLGVRVLAEDAEQPAHLGQRIPRRLPDGLELRAALLGQALDREARALGLDGDRRDVVRDDVVQVARDAGALLHRGLVLQRADHASRVSSRSAIASPRWRRESPSASAATTTMSSSTPENPAPSPENGSIALKRNGSARRTAQRLR